MTSFCHKATLSNIIVIVCVRVRTAPLVPNVYSVLFLELGHMRLLR